jgi:hypothetical protein
MREPEEIRLPVHGVESLVWDGDTLVDWVAGGRRYLLSGDVAEANVRYAYDFDAATSLQDSGFAAIYTRCGTKGLILRDGKVIREINRSFYCASAYEYPIVLSRLPSGREVLVHCPADYNRLEVEDLTSGETLTHSTMRHPSDFFHSRLAISPNGGWLVSAGWLWHPMDQVRFFKLETALNNPDHLDSATAPIELWAEESSAAFLSERLLLVALFGLEEDEDRTQNRAELRVLDLERGEQVSAVRLADRVGTLMPLGSHHALALYGHPRLLDLQNGSVLRSWPHIQTGTQVSSILRGDAKPPPLALDPYGKRLAVAGQEGITVLQFAP